MIYAYNGHITHDLEALEMEIASSDIYCGEEGLMNIIENDIETIDTFEELRQWCNYEGYEIEELYYEFGIDISELVKEKNNEKI